MDTVDTKIAEIKANMPEVYKAIQAKAAQIGTRAFGLVRRGLAGQPGCFYAFENGRVVGTPFQDLSVQADIAKLMVQFGCAHVCIFAMSAPGIVSVPEVSHGPH